MSATKSLPVRAREWTRLALRDLVYSGAVLVWSVAAFSILVAGISVVAPLLLLVVGVFAWVGFVYVVRWTTWVDRRLASWQRRRVVAAVRRQPATSGFMPMLKAVSTDPQTWRDLTWLLVTSCVGFVTGFVAVTAAGLAIELVSMPGWYWAVSAPSGQHWVTNFGTVTIDTAPEALAAAAIGLVVVPVVLLLARGGAAMHAALATRLLDPPPSCP